MGRLQGLTVVAIALIALVLASVYVAPVGLAANTRDPLKQPFRSDSIWNLPIGANASYVAAGIKQGTSAGGMQVDNDVLILTPSAPFTSVYYNSDGWGSGTRCAAQGGALFSAPIPGSFVVPGAHSGNPDGTTPNYATAILGSDGVTLYQGQPFARCAANGTATMWWYQVNEKLDGLGNSGAHGGSMLSSIGGTVRLGELIPGGTIHHVVKVNLDGTNLYSGLGGFRWPATTHDACAPGCYTGTNPALRMGALLALQPNYNFFALETDAGRILAHAFQDYGGYAVDNAGWPVYGLAVEFSPSGRVVDEFRTAWGFDINPPNKATPWARDLDRIYMALAVLDNWDATIWSTVSASNGTLGAGLGLPRVPWAPPLGGAPPPPPPPPPGLPSAPQGLFASAGNAQVGLTWQQPASNGGTPIVNYNIWRGTTSGGESFLAQIGNLTSYTDTAVANGQTYYYQVTAVSWNGEGPRSNEASAKPVAPPSPPSAPRSLQATAGNRQVTLTWQAPASNGGTPIVNYNVWRGTSSGGESFLTQIGNITTYTDTGLTNGQTYYYQVTAVSWNGEGPRSAEVSAKPVAPPLGGDFTWTISGRTVTFTLSAWGGTTPYRFRVTYGDGTSSGWIKGTERTHTYTHAGQFKVVLTIVDAASNTITITKSVTVS